MRFWYELWLLKHSYYLVEAMVISDSETEDEAYGKMIFKESELCHKYPPKEPKSKVTKLVPKNKK